MTDRVTGDGYEQQMQTNHLSHFLLSSLLMPCLEGAASTRGQARIVSHSSGARHGSPLNAKFMARGESGSFGGGGFKGGFERYHQTKLANVVFTEALQVRSYICSWLCIHHELKQPVFMLPMFCSQVRSKASRQS